MRWSSYAFAKCTIGVLIWKATVDLHDSTQTSLMKRKILSCDAVVFPFWNALPLSSVLCDIFRSLVGAVLEPVKGLSEEFPIILPHVFGDYSFRRSHSSTLRILRAHSHPHHDMCNTIFSWAPILFPFPTYPLVICPMYGFLHHREIETAMISCPTSTQTNNSRQCDNAKPGTRATQVTRWSLSPPFNPGIINQRPPSLTIQPRRIIGKPIPNLYWQPPFFFLMIENTRCVRPPDAWTRLWTAWGSCCKVFLNFIFNFNFNYFILFCSGASRELFCFALHLYVGLLDTTVKNFHDTV